MNDEMLEILLSRLCGECACWNSDNGDDSKCLECEAVIAIESLMEQMKLAHEILASEQLAWLLVGTSREKEYADTLRPTALTYWTQYGGHFIPKTQFA